jgi:hypothetical protein
LDDWVRFPAGAGNSFLRRRVYTGSGVHPASNPMIAEDSEHEADHISPSSAEIKGAWSYTSTPQYVCMAWCLIKHRENFTFYLYFTTIYFSSGQDTVII